MSDNIISFPTISRDYHTAHQNLVELLITAAEEARGTGLLRSATALRVHEGMRSYFKAAEGEFGEVARALL